MKYLITGANGVVGKNLLELLQNYPESEVWGCGRDSKNSDRYFNLDLMSRTDVQERFALGAFDCVVHCAADIKNPSTFKLFNNNTTTTLNVVEACIATKVKTLVHTSGLPVIGSIKRLPITESHPAKPQSPYHLSKLHSEQILEQYCQDKLKLINVRIPSPVGLHMPLRSAFPIFLDKIKKHQIIRITGNPETKQNFLDMRDLADFIYKTSVLEGKSGLFNVAAKIPYSYSELAQTMIIHLNSRSQIEHINSAEHIKAEVWDVSTEKAKTFYQYEAKFDLIQTLNWVS